MFLVMINVLHVQHTNNERLRADLNTADAGLPRLPAKTEGWSPIHVFYGDESGLGAPVDKKWFSQVHQDEVLMDLIGPNGYFIDLASNDAMEFSNTLALERHGWNGLCIEPNPRYWYGLSHRKCTVVAALVGATKEKVPVKFRGVYGGILGKMDQKMANRKHEPDAEQEERYTAPIVEVLKKFNVPKEIDYLSLDVEGAEHLIMKNFPFETYHIKVMTVERPSKELRQLLDEKGFVFLKDLAWWGETLWAHKSAGFTPEHPKVKAIKTEERN
jgi:Methyltransferase FkbM domain